MTNPRLVRRIYFTAITLVLSAFVASPTHAQSFDFKSIKTLNPVELEKSNIIIDRIGPAGIVKRLDVEKVLPEVNVSKKIAEAKDQPVAKVLRDLVTSSSKTGFKTSLNNALGIDLNTISTDVQTELFGTTPTIEASTEFQKNVASLVEKQSGEPGFLRIWRGQKVVKPDVYPDVVLISGNEGICTGTLIDTQHVVTAAHCFCEGVSREVAVGTSLLDVTARSDVDPDKSRSHIDCDKMKPDNVAQNVGQGDIALLTLKTPLQSVAVRRIATEPVVRAAASVRAVGFGKTEGDSAGTKFVVDIVIGSYDCRGAAVSGAGKYGCTPDTEMIAAGLNRDTCSGDSGGPVYILGQDINLYLAAVTSRSVDPSGACGKGGIYAKLTVPQVKQWLIDGGVAATAFAQ
ncbi:trypsin-like serine protease [Bradyrhizobium sp. Pha-3]|uniref:S1 family peptidase n=1 Tax=Bradyrhizobium sp. Pha-3 TaxID=208375 RepID=UPI0035D51D11